MRDNRDNPDVNTSGGNYNERIEGNYIQNTIINILSCIQGEQERNSEFQALRVKNEQRLLDEVKNRVDPWLNESLLNKILITLRKELQPDKVEPLWDSEVKVGRKKPEPLSDDLSILDIFDRDKIKGLLLILGMPGSGKTITILELAKALIERAEQLPDYPVPVLLNLSSWQNNCPALQKWLISEIRLEYGIRPGISKQLVEGRRLLLMLDGLDEIPLNKQADCVKAINQFLRGDNRPQFLVVCSRIENYGEFTDKLYLNGAIYLQQLTDTQIQNFLRDLEQTNFWELVQNNQDLLDLIRNPLFLSVSTLVCSQLSSQEWQQIASSKNPLQGLLDAYICQMFTRSFKNSPYDQKSAPGLNETRTKLCWLAKQMEQEYKTDFLIEQMQPSSSLRDIRQRFFYRLLLVLICGVIGQLVGWIFWGVALLNLAIGKNESDKEYKIHSDINEFVSQAVEESDQSLNDETIFSNKLLSLLLFLFLFGGFFSNVCYSIVPLFSEIFKTDSSEVQGFFLFC